MPELVFHHYDQNLGGRNLDWELLQFVSEEFKNDTGLDPRDHKKSILRLMDDVEKTRIALSGDHEANIDVDNIVGDEPLE